MLSHLRRWGFWAVDRIIHRGEHRKYYNITRDAYLHGTDRQSVNQSIQQLLKHACATTTFYKKYFETLSLESFPIVNKNTYKAQWEHFVSSEYAQNPKCHKECTSGSTGIPLEILYSPQKTVRRSATSIYIFSLANYLIGERQAFMRVWVRQCNKSKLRCFAENLIMVDTIHMSDAFMKDLCKEIIEKRVQCLQGYASSLETLSKYIATTKTNMSGARVKSIIPISEALSPQAKANLEKQFRCRVAAVYGAEEFGTIGVQDKSTLDYYIDTSSVYIEVLKLQSDEAAADGEPGRLVITDLCNYAFPLIRYENGDIVVRKQEILPNGRIITRLSEILGRQSDIIYDTFGNPLSPYVITNKMWEIEGIKQWQFIQTGKNTYLFKLNSQVNSLLEQQILERVQVDFGKTAQFEFEYVDEIPVMESGKRKYIMNVFSQEAK